MIKKKYKDDSTEYSLKIISDNTEVADTSNKLFLNITPNLKKPAILQHGFSKNEWSCIKFNK